MPLTRGLKLKRVKLTTRLSMGLGVVLLLLIGIAGYAVYRMEVIGQLLNEVAGAGQQRSQAIRDMERSTRQISDTLHGMATKPVTALAESLTRITTYASVFERNSANLRSLTTSSTELGMIDIGDRALENLQSLLLEAKKEGEGQGDGAIAYYVKQSFVTDSSRWNRLLDVWTETMVRLGSLDDARSLSISKTAAGVATSGRWIFVAAVAIAFVFALVTAWRITNDVRSSIALAIGAAHRMASHDLSEPIVTEREDEIGQLLTSLEDMRQRLNELAAGVKEVTQCVHEASAEISQGSNHLSQRTEQAAATLQRATSAMESLLGSVRQTSSSADEASKLSSSANDLAVRGEATVSQAVRMMAEVERASKRIAEIIAMIDGVASQTNILALNAAVEAARAGEHGRGFAVVAGEVRSLAMSTTGAAGEVKTLVKASLAKVADGVEQVSMAGVVSQEIRSSVDYVANLILSISYHATQQLKGIQETRNAFVALEEMAQQNASMAEETAAAACSLNEQASRLSDLVVSFKLDSTLEPFVSYRLTGSVRSA